MKTVYEQIVDQYIREHNGKQKTEFEKGFVRALLEIRDSFISYNNIKQEKDRILFK